MYAIFHGRLGHIKDDFGDGVTVDFMDGRPVLDILYGAQSLVVDPTDDQVAAAKHGKPIPIDAAFEREVLMDMTRMLTHSTTDPALSPMARAHARDLLRQANARRDLPAR